MTQYLCESCGSTSNKKNEYQCPTCMTMDSLHEVTHNYEDEEDFFSLDVDPRNSIFFECE